MVQIIIKITENFWACVRDVRNDKVYLNLKYLSNVKWCLALKLHVILCICYWIIIILCQIIIVCFENVTQYNLHPVPVWLVGRDSSPSAVAAVSGLRAGGVLVASCDGGGKKAVKTFTASFFRCDDPDDLAWCKIPCGVIDVGCICIGRPGRSLERGLSCR